MKAIIVENPGKQSSLAIKNAPTPQPEANEILVKIEATALNRADIYQRSGNYPPPEGASNILGLEMAGVVHSTGAQVTRWSAGDRVFGLLPGGGYAQYCTLPAAMAMPMPAHYSFEQAAAVPETFLTAYQALIWIAKLQQNETLLMHAGGSGVGTAGIQLARALRQARIATTASKKQKLQTCHELGAELLINYKEHDFASVITKKWGPQAVDVIVDFVGGPYWHPNLEVLDTDGRLVYLSFLGGPTPDDVTLAPILQKRLHIYGSTLRSRSLDYKTKLTQAFWGDAQALLDDGSMAPIIDSVFDWTETEAAHRYMNQNKNTGKIVLTGM